MTRTRVIMSCYSEYAYHAAYYNYVLIVQMIKSRKLTLKSSLNTNIRVIMKNFNLTGCVISVNLLISYKTEI